MKKTKCHFVLSAFLLVLLGASGLVTDLTKRKHSTNPGLADLVQLKSENVKLECRLEIGKGREGDVGLPRFVMFGMTVELSSDTPTKDYPGLPGVNGPRPSTSGGAFAVKVTEEPYFVNLNGMQRVPFKDGCWEVVWRNDAPFGTLICGFNLPKSVSHNGAHLPDGRLYMSFPVWTEKGLAAFQSKKHELGKRVEGFQQKKLDAVVKMHESNNLFTKMKHYRDAAYAMEQMDFSGIHCYNNVPRSDEVVPLANGMLVHKKGSLSSKGEGLFGQPRHDFTGTVHITTQENDNDGFSP